MKRKAIVLLSSVLAGALLVGGAFAAYSVTDNADPLGVNVTPGDLEEDGTKYVTMEWGATTSLTDITQLKVGENRKVGVLNLKSTSAYRGDLVITLTDKSDPAKDESLKDLIDYLVVYLYEGDQDLGSEGALPDATAKATIGLTTTPKTVTYENAIGTSTGKEYSVFLTLDSSANPVFPQMATDKVELTVDWKPKSGEEATENVVYFAKPAGWAGMKAYAWKGEKNNGAWPGVDMVVHNGDVYKISLPAGMERVIFNDGTNDDNKKVETPLASWTAETPFYDGEAWTAIPAQKDYYLVGAINGEDWATPNTFKFTVNPTNPAEFVLENVELKKDDRVKVAYFDGTSAVKDGDYVWAGDDLAISETNTYTFYFSKDEKNDWATGATWQDQFGFAKHLWVVPATQEQSHEIPEADKLVLDVDLGEYANDDAVCYVHYWGEDIEAGDVLIVDGKATINKNYEKLCIVRMPSDATSLDWDTCWNKTADILKGTGTLTFVSWDGGEGGLGLFNFVK